MSSAAKEKKRAADREAQRLNRARTKAYITHLEQTSQDLTGPNPSDNISQKLAQQERKNQSSTEYLAQDRQPRPGCY